jgi:hypothetical protein
MPRRPKSCCSTARCGMVSSLISRMKLVGVPRTHTRPASRTGAASCRKASTDYRRAFLAGFWNWGLVLSFIASISGFVFVLQMTGRDETNGVRGSVPLSLTFLGFHPWLYPGGHRAGRACPHVQPGCPTRRAPPAAPARQLHMLSRAHRSVSRLWLTKVRPCAGSGWGSAITLLFFALDPLKSLHEPWKIFDTLEETLIPLPKFVERSPTNAMTFLYHTKV